MENLTRKISSLFYYSFCFLFLSSSHSFPAADHVMPWCQVHGKHISEYCSTALIKREYPGAPAQAGDTHTSQVKYTTNALISLHYREFQHFGYQKCDHVALLTSNRFRTSLPFFFPGPFGSQNVAISNFHSVQTLSNSGFHTEQVQIVIFVRLTNTDLQAHRHALVLRQSLVLPPRNEHTCTQTHRGWADLNTKPVWMLSKENTLVHNTVDLHGNHQWRVYLWSSIVCNEMKLIFNFA